MKKKGLLLVATILSNLPFIALAQAGDGFQRNPLPGGDFKTFIDKLFGPQGTILTIIWMIAVAFVIVMFVLAGFKFLRSHGDPSGVEDAKQDVIWGIVGVVVIVLAWSIVKIITLQLGL